MRRESTLSIGKGHNLLIPNRQTVTSQARAQQSAICECVARCGSGVLVGERNADVQIIATQPRGSQTESALQLVSCVCAQVLEVSECIARDASL